MSKSRWFKETFTPINQDWSNGASIDSLETTKLTINGHTAADLSTSQTFSGVKTFSSNPLMSNIQSTNANALVKKEYVDKKINDTLLTSVYPVGSVMIRYDNIDPGTISGLTGTNWELLSSGDYVRTTTSKTEKPSRGGSLTSGATKLTDKHLPSHRHSVALNTSTDGSHTHAISHQEGNFSRPGGSWYADPGMDSNDTRGPGIIRSAGSHYHNISGYTGYFGDASQSHTHTIEPSYVRMAFWKRIS